MLKTVYALENDTEQPRACIGIGAAFGYYNVHNSYGGQMQWKSGYGLGGGLIAENMFTDTFGLHSGIWFSHFTLKIKFPDDNSDMPAEHKVKSNLFTLPFYLITSFNSSIIILNLLTGFNFSYIAESNMQPGPNGQNSEDIRKYLGFGQIGAGAGFELLFRITRFTRFFISCTGEYYFNELVTDGDDTMDNLYLISIRSGIMLCTF